MVIVIDNRERKPCEHFTQFKPFYLCPLFLIKSDYSFKIFLPLQFLHEADDAFPFLQRLTNRYLQPVHHFSLEFEIVEMRFDLSVDAVGLQHLEISS